MIVQSEPTLFSRALVSLAMPEIRASIRFLPLVLNASFLLVMALAAPLIDVFTDVVMFANVSMTFVIFFIEVVSTSLAATPISLMELIRS